MMKKESKNSSSDLSASSPYNNANIELVVGPNQEIMVIAPSPIQFAHCENEDEVEELRILYAIGFNKNLDFAQFFFDQIVDCISATSIQNMCHINTGVLFFSDLSASSPYNNTDIELVVVPNQEIEVIAASSIHFALCENEDEVEVHCSMVEDTKDIFDSPSSSHHNDQALVLLPPSPTSNNPPALFQPPPPSNPPPTIPFHLSTLLQDLLQPDIGDDEANPDGKTPQGIDSDVESDDDQLITRKWKTTSLSGVHDAGEGSLAPPSKKRKLTVNLDTLARDCRLPVEEV
ncbi:unnamed protein product [Lactuca saligna]|uniref:Uncharacterized protein n=1 Tax=Lactuca saligna TaxID=75948 RepID=A0AA36A3B3_LACSI|nr:unnamed protein product [Lactuca saligna]